MIDPKDKEKEPKAKEAEELSDDELDNVSGGLGEVQEGQGGYTPPKQH
ncbi:MAG: bacteriocin [Anaerolineaceae bacterium]|nr:bacteriocin [Anaerolineaceae bacterium]